MQVYACAYIYLCIECTTYNVVCVCVCACVCVCVRVCVCDLYVVGPSCQCAQTCSQVGGVS